MQWRVRAKGRVAIDRHQESGATHIQARKVIFASTTDPLWERACSRRGQYIQHQCKLTHRLREQARSHIGFRLTIGFGFPTDLLWERACSRKGLHIQHQCKLTHRLREQARSHRSFEVTVRFVSNTNLFYLTATHVHEPHNLHFPTRVEIMAQWLAAQCLLHRLDHRLVIQRITPQQTA